MITKEYNIELDLKMKAFNCYAFFTTGDVGVNVLNISILDDQEPVDLSGVMYATINFKRPDERYVLAKNVEIVNASEGVLRYMLGTSEIEHEGRVYATINLYGNNGQRLTSTAFYFTVKESLISDNAIESTSEYTLLTKLIDEVNAMTPPAFHFGEGLPEELLGKEFDYYLDMVEKKVYEKRNSQWSFLSNYIRNATIEEDGFMSNADKIALDSLVSIGFTQGDKEVLDKLAQLGWTETDKTTLNNIKIDVEQIRTDLFNLQEKMNNPDELTTETFIEVRTTNPAIPKVGQIWIINGGV